MLDEMKENVKGTFWLYILWQGMKQNLAMLICVILWVLRTENYPNPSELHWSSRKKKETNQEPKKIFLTLAVIISTTVCWIINSSRVKLLMKKGWNGKGREATGFNLASGVKVNALTVIRYHCCRKPFRFAIVRSEVLMDGACPNTSKSSTRSNKTRYDWNHYSRGEPESHFR